MRILHVIQRYWPALGGAEAHLGEISARLVADGHEVTVVTTDALDFELFWDPRRRRIARSMDQWRGVTVLRFPVRHLPGSRVTYAAIRRALWLLSTAGCIPARELSALAHFTPWTPGLWRWLDRCDEKFDLVAGMTICFEPLIQAGLRLAKRQAIPFVVYPLTHLGAGARPGADALSRFYTMRHQLRLVKESDALIAQTPAEQRFYAGHGVPYERILVAGPGVNPAEVLGGNAERFRSQHQLSAPLVASLSPTSYDKGSVHLVEAVRGLWQEGVQVELVLAGTILEPFRRYLDGLPEADRQRIHMPGPLSEQEKADLFAAADIFAMPSRADSFGIVYLEAWLYGKPVIGARTHGVSDLIAHGDDGLLVPFGGVPALRDAIRSLLDRPNIRTAMGALGRQKVLDLHTWDRKYPLVRDLYCRMAQGRR